MFSNPFTPESKKAKKSLFKHDKKGPALNLSRYAKEKIADLATVDFYGVKVLKKQAMFLSELQDYWLSILGVVFSPNEILGLVPKMINRQDGEKDLVIKINPMGQIEDLTIDGHQVTGCLLYFPETICNLIHLKKLNLDNNKIEFIPDEFFELKNLKELGIRGNKLSDEMKAKIKAVFPFAQI